MGLVWSLWDGRPPSARTEDVRALDLLSPTTSAGPMCWLVLSRRPLWRPDPENSVGNAAPARTLDLGSGYFWM